MVEPNLWKLAGQLLLALINATAIQLAALRISIDHLGNSRSLFTDEIAKRFGDTVTRTLMKLRGCSSNVVPMVPHRPQS
jgi:hypothetical protein